MRTTIGLAVLAAVAIGCSSLPPLDLFELPEGKAVKAAVTTPDPARLGVALAYPLEEWASSREDFGHAVRLRLDGLRLRAEFVRDLEKLGLFEAVEAVGDGTIHEDEHAYIEEARRKGLDLLLILRPKQNRVAYKGHGSMYVPNLVLWVLFWFPSWWVADEVFASEVALDGALFRVADGREVHQGNWKGRFETALDDFERNWRLWGILRIPGALDTEDYEGVGDILSPHAFNLSKLEMMKDLTGFVRTRWPSLRSLPGKPVEVVKPESGTRPTRPPKEGTEPKPPKPVEKPAETVKPAKRALVIGAGAFKDAKIPAVRFADRDAKAFADFLKKKKGFPEENVHVLAGEDATLINVRKALKAFAGKPGFEKDVRVLYFAGRGLARPGGAGVRLYLVLRDTRPENPTRTALFLTDVWDLLSSSKGKVRIVLDASFSGSGASRGLGEEIPGAEEILAKRFASKKNWAVLYGAGEGGGALELEELPGGLFTHFLIEGLSGKADIDGKEGVTFDEIEGFLSQNVASTADLLGESQVPYAGAGTSSASVIP